MMDRHRCRIIQKNYSEHKTHKFYHEYRDIIILIKQSDLETDVAATY